MNSNLNLKKLRESLFSEIENLKEEAFYINDYIAENPELGYREYKASSLLTEKLNNHNFTIERNLSGIETAFRASYNFTEDGPTIAFLCEYDALPDIGHGCGHNMIAAMSTGAGIALSKLNIKGGRIEVIGCPAEETGGAKVQMTEAGVFDNVDCAMLLHPSNINQVYSTTLAIKALQFNFHGQTAHAAGAPEKGINALDGVIQFFNGINALREHLRDDARIHGIITNGGEAANIVPDEAEAQFYFRARDKKYLQEIIKKVEKTARGAALMTGSRVEWKEYENANDDLKPNRALADIFEQSMKEIGISEIEPAAHHSGSSDMGNVSHVIPVIHPYINLGSELTGHTRELAEKTTTSEGHTVLIDGIKSLALTGLKIYSDRKKLEKIKQEFKKTCSD
ncbi:MAG: M20 family metallopeptidase [Bacillota bacterium]